MGMDQIRRSTGRAAKRSSPIAWAVAATVRTLYCESLERRVLLSGAVSVFSDLNVFTIPSQNSHEFGSPQSPAIVVPLGSPRREASPIEAKRIHLLMRPRTEPAAIRLGANAATAFDIRWRSAGTLSDRRYGPEVPTGQYQVTVNGSVHDVLGTSFEITGLRPGTTYSYIISAEYTVNERRHHGHGGTLVGGTVGGTSGGVGASGGTGGSTRGATSGGTGGGSGGASGGSGGGSGGGGSGGGSFVRASHRASRWVRAGRNAALPSKGAMGAGTHRLSPLATPASIPLRHTVWSHSRQVFLPYFSGSFTTGMVAPTVVSARPAPTNSALKPTLSWQHTAGAASYRIVVDTNQSDLPNRAGDRAGPTTVFSALTARPRVTLGAGLSPGMTYYWRVQGRDVHGNLGPWSAVQSFTTASPTPPIVTANPANQTRHVGTTVTFSAAASGIPTPAMLWQVSSDGGATFTSVPGPRRRVLRFVTETAKNGWQYRALFTNSYGSAVSTPAILTVLSPRR